MNAEYGEDILNPKVRSAVSLMKNNLDRKLALGEIAEATCLHHSRLIYLFKTEMGSSPLQYHKLLRLQRVCELLEKTPWTVDRIRLEVGYDHSHFFKDFRDRFGLTPSQYRASRNRPLQNE